MKHLFTVIAFCAATLATASAFPTSAAADGGRHQSARHGQGSQGIIGLSFFFGDKHREGFRDRRDRRYHKLRRHHRDKRHHKLRRHHRNKRHHARARHFPRHGYYAGRAGLDHGARCYPVKRRGIDRHGYPVLFAGRMCTDSYGAPYILNGSRRIVRRY